MAISRATLGFPRKNSEKTRSTVPRAGLYVMHRGEEPSIFLEKEADSDEQPRGPQAIVGIIVGIFETVSKEPKVTFGQKSKGY
jgi:hypothetical protein